MDDLGIARAGFRADALGGLDDDDLTAGKGKRASDNPWEATTLEWTTATPPPHDNFGGKTPTVYRGAYEFGVPGAPDDYVMQTTPDETGANVSVAAGLDEQGNGHGHGNGNEGHG